MYSFISVSALDQRNGKETFGTPFRWPGFTSASHVLVERLYWYWAEELTILAAGLGLQGGPHSAYLQVATVFPDSYTFTERLSLLRSHKRVWSMCFVESRANVRYRLSLNFCRCVGDWKAIRSIGQKYSLGYRIAYVPDQ